MRNTTSGPVVTGAFQYLLYVAWVPWSDVMSRVASGADGSNILCALRQWYMVCKTRKLETSK